MCIPNSIHKLKVLVGLLFLHYQQTDWAIFITKVALKKLAWSISKVLQIYFTSSWTSAQNHLSHLVGCRSRCLISKANIWKQSFYKSDTKVQLCFLVVIHLGAKNYVPSQAIDKCIHEQSSPYNTCDWEREKNNQ